MACSFIPCAKILSDAIIDGVATYLPPKDTSCWDCAIAAFPVNAGARKHVDLVVVLRMRVPEFWSLPIHCAHKGCGPLTVWTV